MKRVKNFSRLKRLHQRQLRHTERRRLINATYRAKWIPRSPIIESYDRLPNRKNWENRAAHLYPPLDFSLFRNPEPVISFFNQVKGIHQNGRDIFLHLENVSSLTADTMLLMVARTTDERFNRKRMVGGNMPLDSKSRTVFEESGVFGDKVFDLTKVRPRKGSIQRYNNVKVEPATVKYLVDFVSGYFVSREQSSANYETLVELMNNTNLHAGGDYVDEEFWWCSVYELPDKALFNFLDNGQGICETALKRFGRSLLQKLGLTDNAKLLEDIIHDKIRSRTGKFYHGRGLPLIHRRAQKGLINNVIIITNNVFANITTGHYEIMNTFFQGTFIHWEVPKISIIEKRGM